MSVRQLRVVVQADDYEQVVRFYRDVLGLPEEFALDSQGGARVTIMTAGRATSGWPSRLTTPPRRPSA